MQAPRAVPWPAAPRERAALQALMGELAAMCAMWVMDNSCVRRVRCKALKPYSGRYFCHSYANRKSASA